MNDIGPTSTHPNEETSPTLVRSFWGMTKSELETQCWNLGVPRVHAATMMSRVYKDLANLHWQDATLPRILRNFTQTNVSFALPKVLKELQSGYDQSVKFLLSMDDGAQIECVLMPESKRITLCVSSQYGCAQACVFCHTGRMGLRRHLSAGEIVAQVVIANRWILDHPEWLKTLGLPPSTLISNLVFMGMGEPLDNVDEVVSAIRILTEPHGMQMGKRRISVSTAGHLEGLSKLIQELPQVRLALSLHAVTDSERSKIMPINRRWPLANLLAALKDLTNRQKHGVMIQYTLIHGINDSEDHAQKLGDLLEGIRTKINLIPLNKIGPSRFDAPERDSIERFRNQLQQRGFRVLVRYSKGQDIAAACGQLVV